MALAHGRPWAVVLLLCIALAAAAAAAGGAEPPDRDSSRTESVQGPQYPSSAYSVPAGRGLDGLASTQQGPLTDFLGRWRGQPDAGVGQYFEACNKGKKFKTVPCGSWRSAPELSWFGRKTRTQLLKDIDFIECESGNDQARRRDTYHIKVEQVFGQRTTDRQPGYYAHARIMHASKTQPDRHFCWLRVGADQDDEWCQCEVARQGSDLGRKPGCYCFSP